MAKANTTNKEWLDAKATDYSATVQELLAQERAAYEVCKAIRAKVLAAVRAETPVPAGREITGTCFTRWGQWQVIVEDVAQAKTPTTQRRTLADFMAAQSASGHNA